MEKNRRKNTLKAKKEETDSNITTNTTTSSQGDSSTEDASLYPVPMVMRLANQINPPSYFSYPFPDSNLVTGSGGSGTSNNSLTTNETSDSTESNSTSTDEVSEDAWSPTHGMILHTAVAAYAAHSDPDPVTGEINVENLDWDLIANHFPKKDSLSCYSHWKLLNPETVLVRCGRGIMYKHKNLNVQMEMPCVVNHSSGSAKSSSEEQKRKRRKKKNKSPWTPEEEKLIDELQLKFGNKWTKIASYLNQDRTGNDVKNYWHSTKDKIIENRFRRQQQEQAENSNSSSND